MRGLRATGENFGLNNVELVFETLLHKTKAPTMVMDRGPAVVSRVEITSGVSVTVVELMDVVNAVAMKAAMMRDMDVVVPLDVDRGRTRGGAGGTRQPPERGRTCGRHGRAQP